MNGADVFQPSLPGLEDVQATRDRIARMSDAEIDRRFPESTGKNLKSSNPRLYDVAARLFFEFGFSQREIAVICQISRATVAAIVRAEQGGLESRARRSARLRRLRGASEMALTRLEGLLCHPEALERAGISGVAGALKVITEVADRLEQDLRDKVVEVVPASDAKDKMPEEMAKYLEA